MFSTGKRVRALQLQVDALTAHVKAMQMQLDELETLVKAGTPASLLAEIDDIRAAADMTRASNRKEFASLWGRMGGRGHKAETFDTVQHANGDFEAMLTLQSSGVPPPK
jgi:hypothetical protein